MIIDKDKTVAFTGYREDKIKISTNNPDICHIIKIKLREKLLDLYNNGYTTFLSGMAEGFDMIAADVVLDLKKEYSDIALVSVIPFTGQTLSFTPQQTEHHNDILNNCDSKIILYEHYFKGVFFLRNDFLINNCSYLVTYYDGQKGGTQYTNGKAKKNLIPIINICEEINSPSLFNFI